ncbi:MAG: hypothetical protein QM496_07390, partial [Verrucomicrobiota bacterium]
GERASGRAGERASGRAGDPRIANPRHEANYPKMGSRKWGQATILDKLFLRSYEGIQRRATDGKEPASRITRLREKTGKLKG